MGFVLYRASTYQKLMNINNEWIKIFSNNPHLIVIPSFTLVCELLNSDSILS